MLKSFVAPHHWLLGIILLCVAFIIVPLADGASNNGVFEIAQANNQFGINLFDQLSSRPGNLFFSPFSIEMALAMTYNGRGEGKPRSRWGR